MDGAVALQLARTLSKRERFKQRIFYPQDFGAQANGMHDDLPAIHAALEAASPEDSPAVGNIGGSVIFAPGDYRVDGPVAPTFAQGVSFLGTAKRGLRGHHFGAARIRAAGAHAVIGGHWHASSIENLGIDNDIYGGPGITADIDKSRIAHCELTGWVGYGMQLCSDIWKQNGTPTYLNEIVWNHIDRSDGIGLHGNYLMWDSKILYNNIGSSFCNIMLLGGPHKVLYNWLDGDPGPDYNIYCENVGHTTQIIGNYLENCNKSAIYLGRPDWEAIGDRRLTFQIVNNQILNGGGR